jgi:hypothetical protein
MKEEKKKKKATHPLNNKLSNPISDLNEKFNIRVIKQQHLNLAPVISINNTSTGINEVLGSESTARSDTAI